LNPYRIANEITENQREGQPKFSLILLVLDFIFRLRGRGRGGLSNQ
jgi:hypothetical protein